MCSPIRNLNPIRIRSDFGSNRIGFIDFCSDSDRFRIKFIRIGPDSDLKIIWKNPIPFRHENHKLKTIIYHVNARIVWSAMLKASQRIFFTKKCRKMQKKIKNRWWGRILPPYQSLAHQNFSFSERLWAWPWSNRSTHRTGGGCKN